VAVAAICFSIAAFYAALILWQWRRRKKRQRTAGDRDLISRE
jgi:membrane protein implicated in regulation of membrane protease activity